MRHVWWVFLCFAGCDERTASADPDDAPDAAQDAGGVDAGISDASVVDSAVGGQDAALMDAGAENGPNCLPDEPATRTVRFTVRNPGAAPIYVPVQGDLCQPYAINNAEGRSVPRRVFNACSEECACLAGTPLSWVTAYQRVEPGQTHVFEWQAQQVVRCEREVHCPEFENTGRDPVFNVASPRWRNLEPATFEVQLAYEPRLPEGCEDGGDPRIECEGPHGMHWFGRCESSAVLTTQFDLQADGITEVDISAP
jgi:hypothetical protein